MYVCVLSYVWLFVTPWIVACQWDLAGNPIYLWDFPGKEYWNSISYSTGPSRPRNLSLLCLLHWQEDSLPLCHLRSPKRVLYLVANSCPTFATPWTVARQAPLSMRFSRQEYWRGLPCPPPGDLPDPGIKPRSPALHADSLPSEPPGKPM